jgi:hypothetical protein
MIVAKISKYQNYANFDIFDYFYEIFMSSDTWKYMEIIFWRLLVLIRADISTSL